MTALRVRTARDGVPVVEYRATDTVQLESLARLAATYRWAARRGLDTPDVLEESPGLLVVRWYDHQRPQGQAYVDLALDAAARVAACPEPPPTGGRTWRASRLDLPRRAWRMARGGVPLRRFARARDAAAALPAVTPAHNDFHPSNVLNLGDRVVVIDWEFAGLAPAGTDAVRFWSALASPQDRAHALERIVDATAPGDRAALAVLVSWIAWRSLAQSLVGPPGPAEEQARAVARSAVAEAEELAARISRNPSSANRPSAG